MMPTAPAKFNSDPDLLDERALSKLHWRCRRGLLENDLFIEKFFQRYECELTTQHAEGLAQLMDLSDNDLLDLLLRRKEPVGLLAQAPAREVLQMLRPPVTSVSH